MYYDFIDGWNLKLQEIYFIFSFNFASFIGQPLQMVAAIHLNLILLPVTAS